MMEGKEMIRDFDLWDAAFLHAPIGMGMFNEANRFIKVNGSLCRYLGYEAFELQNTSLSDIFVKEDFEHYTHQIQKLQDGTSNFFEFEARLLHKLGSYVWLLVHVSIGRKMDSPLYFGQFVDITQKKQSNTRLQYLQSTYNLAAEGLAILSMDGRIIQVNHAFEEIFGWKEDEIKGKYLPVTPFFSRDKVLYLLEQCQLGKTLRDVEIVKIKKDGSLITTNMTLSPIVDTNGQVVAVSKMIRDISSEKSTGILLNSFIKYNISAILIYDKNKRIVHVNDAFYKTFDLTQDEMIGKSLKEVQKYLVPDDLQHETDEFYNTVIVQKKVYESETLRLKKDGTPVNVSIIAFPIKDHKEIVDGFAVILQDITDKKKTEELMIQSEKLSIAGQLAAAIAHEIRNPITSIKGFLKLIRFSSGKDQYYDIINSEINRIETILTELLGLAKPQQNNINHCNFKEILTQVVALLTPEANMKNIIISSVLSENLPEIFCDANQLKQVFINLIKNAIDAMPDGGSIKLEALPCPEYESILIKVSDTGHGMPPEIIERIGQPFLTTKEKGTGLGLMVSKNIIEEHQGIMTISSEENKGTTIRIEIPY